MVAEESSENAPAANDGSAVVVVKNPGFTPPNPQSKNQLKRLKKRAAFEEKRKEKRKKEKAKQKEKRKLAIAQGLPAQIGPSRKALKKRQNTTTEALPSIKVAIDLDYDELMTDHDIAKCVKQCLRIYTINRRSEKPGQLNFTGLKRDGRIHEGFKRHDGWENWHVNYCFDETHIEKFKNDEIIYLTCESDNVLERLETEKVYCIGGLVDHNHHKGVCHDRALRANVQTARLPLSEHVEMKTRSVLSTFHVFEILLRVAGGSSWTDAILATIPIRKGAKPKAAETTDTNTVNKIVDVVDVNKKESEIVIS